MSGHKNRPKGTWCADAVVILLLLGLCCGLSGCGGSDNIPIPLNAIAQGLADEPTFSVILDDMKSEGTLSKSYYHNYLIVHPEGSSRTGWLQVPESYYAAKEDFLGMAVMTKKDGQVDETAAPAGYAFVGDENYGRWRQDSNGNSFWEFYGKYAFFSSLFGGWYHPVYRNDYSMYRQHHSNKQAFFGRNKEFGSTGSLVKQKRPSFFEQRMSGASAKKSSFQSTVQSKIGRTSSSLRGRSGGSGK